MGNHPSREQNRSKISLLQKKVPLPSPITTPPELSRCSSSSNTPSSRPGSSTMEDVKICMQKMLGKSITPNESKEDYFSHYSLLDEKEQDRLINTHYVLKHLFGENFSAPVHDLLSKSVSVARDSQSTLEIPPPARVLDVACGNGVWVLEMATAYPHSQFYGIDAASAFPTTIKPPNTTFQQWNLLDPEGFPFPDAHFDYVHMRLVYNCFSKESLKFVLKEMARVLKPGGYIETRDIDPTIKNRGPVTDHFFSEFATRMAQLHYVDVTWTKNMTQVLAQEAGLTDIHHQEVNMGFGLEGPLAASMDSSISDAIRSYKAFTMESFGMTSEQVDQKTDLVLEECALHHSYFNYYMSWGRKPLFLEDETVNPTSFHQANTMVDIVHFADGYTE